MILVCDVGVVHRTSATVSPVSGVEKSVRMNRPERKGRGSIMQPFARATASSQPEAPGEEPAEGEAPVADSSLDEDFRQFVAARSASLLRTAYLLVGDRSHAEDVLQTALTRTYLAWRRLGGFEVVDAYARRVVVTTATSWWRRRWHREHPAPTMPEGAAADPTERWLEREAMWRHLRILPARQRAVLVLRFYEDLTEVQIAEVLGVAVGTVKSQCARGLATLRSRLASGGIEAAHIARSSRTEGQGALGGTA